jgi:hypothetical protein
VKFKGDLLFSIRQIKLALFWFSRLQRLRSRVVRGPSIMSLNLNTPDDVTTLVGASIIPAHLLERAASHARIRAAFDFVGATAFAESEEGGNPVIELTDEAVDLIDAILGKMVEETTDQASTIALLRHAAHEAKKQKVATAGGAAISTEATKPFPTSVAEARDVLSSGSNASGAGKAILTNADLQVALGEVYPSIALVDTDPLSRLPDLNAAAISNIATIPPQPPKPTVAGQQQQPQQQAPATGAPQAADGAAGSLVLPALSVSSAGAGGGNPAPSPAGFKGAASSSSVGAGAGATGFGLAGSMGPPPSKRGRAQ